MAFKVKVRWASEKQTYSDLDLSVSEPPDLFKAQLFALTSVPPERQKLMIKGKLIGSNWTNDVTKFIKNGSVLMLMGSAEALPEEPTVQPTFLEDMSEREVNSACELPPGLVNLGNTCYVNAVIQCLKSLPGLSDALSKYKHPSSLGPNFIGLLRELFGGASSMSLVLFLDAVHSKWPRFAETGEKGHYLQQDANEFLTELLAEVNREMILNQSGKSFIDENFSIKFDKVMTCAEGDSNEKQESSESAYQISCFLSQQVSHLMAGIKLKFEEKLTKHSNVLGRDAEFLHTMSLSRLPRILCVQMVRFYFKAEKNIGAKLLRDVKFPLSLDVYDICSSNLKEKLSPAREAFKMEDDRKAEELQRIKNLPRGQKDDINRTKPEFISPCFETDPGSCNSGYYELQAVLTHQGRNSSSGHYVAWVKHTAQKQNYNDPQQWVKCDDDKLSLVLDPDIQKLSGGGDWHCAYVLFYAARQLEVKPEVMDTKDNIGIEANGESVTSK